MKKPVHINIVGEKNSGKTTLIQSLIRELKTFGVSVGTVKHTSHDHEFDIKGTDSWKHRQAGSQTTVIVSPSKMVCHINEPSKEGINNMIETVFQDYDLILWEGNRNTENDIIECVKNLSEALFVNDDRVIAVVSENKDIEYSNLFSFDENKTLARWLIDKYGLNKHKG
ncbi:MAG: molybdopterin-guanine dinucleotide biosynthesis protein B [Candidatus Hatepunaea meridiana]|nr:molybdopterin-guanine dinucleotide biosynthesis protein B [Candidatus Hatepunaea meridiana]